jgi:hypothetical protein
MDIRSALKSQYHAALGTLREAIDDGVDKLDLSASQSGFPWYEMPKLEHQLVNIRHIQHHAAVLSNRLWRSDGILVDWVARR